MKSPKKHSDRSPWFKTERVFAINSWKRYGRLSVSTIKPIKEIETSSFYENMSEALQKARSMLLNFLVVFFSIFLIFFTISEIRTEYVIIEPFEVPEDLAKDGLTGRVFANKIVDQMDVIKLKSKHFKELRFISDWSQSEIEIEVSGSGISLNKVFRILKRTMGNESTTVTGEVFRIGNDTFLTTRVSGKPSLTRTVEIQKLDSLAHDLLQNIMKNIQPMVLFHYKREVDKSCTDCLSIIKYAISNTPEDDDAEAYSDWGWLLNDEEDYEGAIVKYKKSLQLNNKAVIALLGWADALYGLGRYTEAINKYKEVIKLDPDYLAAYIGWGNALGDLGDNEGAIDMYKKAISLEPDAVVYCSFGDALFNLKDYKGAIAMYKKALELDPMNIDSYVAWGDVLNTLGNSQEAISMYVKALELNPKSVYAHYIWGTTLYSLNDYTGAIAKYKKAINLDSEFETAYLGWGDALYDLKRYKESIAMYKKAIELHPQESDAYFRWGAALEKVSNYAEAIAMYKKAIQLDPKHINFYKSWGDALYFLRSSKS